MTQKITVLGAAVLVLFLGACDADPVSVGDADTSQLTSPDSTPNAAASADASVRVESPTSQQEPSAPPSRPQNLEDLQRAWLQAKGECLQEAGFRAEMAGDGLDIWDPPAEQRAAFNEAITTCEAQAGPVPGDEPLTREELGTLYDLQLQARDCLIEEGYPVTEPSSRETFISLYLTMYEGGADTQPPWFAHEATDGAGDFSAREVCPEPSMADVYRADS